MTHYFVDNREQPDGAHEVHSVGCKRMASDKQYLGDFLSREQANASETTRLAQLRLKLEVLPA